MEPSSIKKNAVILGHPQHALPQAIPLGMGIQFVAQRDLIERCTGPGLGQEDLARTRIHDERAHGLPCG